VSTAVSFADAERAYLAELLERLGPDAPTLCEGWTTRDLAAHLVLRERRLDAAPGIVLPFLGRRTERVQSELARRDYPELVDMVRQGPPAWSPFAVPAIYGLANSVEFFVHHEDVRRAQAGWSARELDADAEALLWQRLTKAARLLFRRVPVGIELDDSTGNRHTARAGTPSVTLRGRAPELTLFAFGRRERTVDLDGPEEAVRALQGASLGL
jgi:uncharacterized protein (TIGR03085 family)